MAIALALPLTASADVETITQPIATLQYDGTLQKLYLAGGSKWGAAPCENATYVRISMTVEAHKPLLAIAVAAKMAGTPVRLFGTCAPDGYFDATYISVES